MHQEAIAPAMAGEKRKRSTTLQDVARAAGVSRTTVSNAFNRPDQLSAAARDRILDVARGLSYPGPNPMARKLRTGRIGAVGLVFGDPLTYAFSDPAALLFLRGIGATCEAAGYSLLIIPITDDNDAQTTIREALVDGFIVYTARTETVVGHVLDRNLPVVTVDRERIPGFAAVRVDDRSGGRQIARHLIDQGHRRLAIIAPRLGFDAHTGLIDRRRRAGISYAFCADRVAGYMEAFAESGMDPLDIPIDERPENHEEAGRAAALNLLRLEPRPTAILAMTDRLAIGALGAAAELGLRVPRDLSVVGFDDIPAAAAASTPLTTVRQPLIRKGELAAEQLLAGESRAGLQVLETELVVRESTGPAPQRTTAQRAPLTVDA